MEPDPNRWSLEIRSLKLGVILAGALVALAISAAAANRDLAGLVMFLSGVVAFISVTGLLQLHYKRQTADALRRINSERENKK